VLLGPKSPSAMCVRLSKPALTISQGYSQDIAVSEKVWLGSADRTTRFGIPWNFMLRDVLQFDTALDDATNRMSTAHRTCDVIFGMYRCVGTVCVGADVFCALMICT
jgi:hypothetical protein